MLCKSCLNKNANLKYGRLLAKHSIILKFEKQRSLKNLLCVLGLVKLTVFSDIKFEAIAPEA
jgi:hypothetical protein